MSARAGELIQTYYLDPRADRAIAALAELLTGPSAEHPNMLYAFARIAMISPEARAGFAQLRERAPRVIDAILRGLDDPAFPRPRSTGELGPLDLDLLWAEFFVTGDVSPARRVATALDGFDLVRDRLTRWLRERGDGFFGRRAIAKYRPVLERCTFPIDYETRTISEGLDLDLHIALCAKAGKLKFAELPIELSVEEATRCATKSAALWSMRSIAQQHPPIAAVCAEEAAKPGGPARRLLAT